MRCVHGLSSLEIVKSSSNLAVLDPELQVNKRTRALR